MTVFEFVLSAIPVAFVFSIVLIYVVSAYWREDSKNLAKEAGRYLRDMQSQIQTGNNNLSYFQDSQNFQPYAIDYQNASQCAENAKNFLAKNYHTYAELRNQIQTQLKKTPRNVVLSPYLWFETRRYFFRFRHDTEKTKLQIDELNHHIEKLHLCKSRTITNAQQIWDEFKKLSELIHALSDQIQGEKWSQVLTAFESIRTELVKIPQPFLEDSVNEDTQHTISQTEVIATHKLLHEESPRLRALKRTCENWETQILLIEDELTKLNEKQKSLNQSIHQLPIGINSSSLLEKMNALKQQTSTIRDHSRRSEPDELRHFLRETRQMDRMLEELELEINSTQQAFTVYIELKKTLQFIWQKLKNLAYTLHESPFLPIVFTESTQTLNQIGAEYNYLVSNSEAPAPEKIRDDSASMQTLLEDCEKLLPQFEILKDAHAELIILLRRLTSKAMEDWQLEMKQILTETQTIPAQNYQHLPAADGLNISKTLREIQTTASSKLPTLNTQLKESAVFSILAEAKNIEQLRNLVNDTLHSQHNQYQTLIEKEETSKEKIHQIQRSLERIDGILLADKNLNQLFKKDIRHANKQHRDLQQRLKDTSKITVQSKHEDINNLYEHQSKMLTNWIEDLSQKNSQDIEKLQGTFDELQESAKIADPDINQVDIFLRQKTKMPDVQEYMVGLNLLDLVDYLETIDDLQRDVAEHQDSLNGILSQINAVIVQINKNNENCTAKMQAAEQWISPDGWNQRALNFDRIRKDYDALQGTIQRFSRETNSVSQYLAKNQNFIQQQNNIESRFDTIIQESRLEDEQISNTNTALELTLNLWENLASRLQHDRTANAEIRSMLQEYNQRTQKQHNRYERGNLKINEYINLIKRIDRDLNNETVETENNKFIDINGHEFH